MRDKKSAPRDALPDNFAPFEELWCFWDTHSSADYDDVMGRSKPSCERLRSPNTRSRQPIFAALRRAVELIR